MTYVLQLIAGSVLIALGVDTITGSPIAAVFFGVGTYGIFGGIVSLLMKIEQNTTSQK